jgi:hypothetical protein
MRIPEDPMLEKPGLGECPPLRTANLTLKKDTILRIMETSWAELGNTAQAGASSVVAVLSNGRSQLAD